MSAATTHDNQLISKMATVQTESDSEGDDPNGHYDGDDVVLGRKGEKKKKKAPARDEREAERGSPKVYWAQEWLAYDFVHR